MSELIERQAVIDLWDKYHPTIAVDAMQYDAELRQLPHAQPTQLTDDDIEIIRVHLSAIKENLCNQHRWNEAKEYEALIDRLSAQPEPCEDAVSREAVQDTIHKWCGDCVDCETIAYEVITKIPPVTPKQRTGYWYPVGMAEAVGGESAQWGSAIAYHRCSECDERALQNEYGEEVLSKLCPHCWAKMEKWSDD